MPEINVLVDFIFEDVLDWKNPFDMSHFPSFANSIRYLTYIQIGEALEKLTAEKVRTLYIKQANFYEKAKQHCKDLAPQELINERLLVVL